MVGSHPTPTPFTVYLNTEFEQSAAALTPSEQRWALDICDAMEREGPGEKSRCLNYPKFGDVIIRRQSGVIVLFKEKAMGPRSYIAVAVGRYWRDPASGQWRTAIF